MRRGVYTKCLRGNGETDVQEFFRERSQTPCDIRRDLEGTEVVKRFVLVPV